MLDTFDFISNFITIFHGTCQESPAEISIPLCVDYKLYTFSASISTDYSNRPRIRRSNIVVVLRDEECNILIEEYIHIDYSHNADNFHAEWQEWKETIVEKIKKLNIE